MSYEDRGHELVESMWFDMLLREVVKFGNFIDCSNKML